MAATTPLQWIIYIWGPTLFSMTQSSERKYCHFDENSWLAAPLVILTFPMCFCLCKTDIISRSGSLRWRHNGCDSVSNHQPHDCLLNRYSDADQRKHQSSASLAFVRGIHRGPVNSPHEWSVTRKMYPFDDVILNICEPSSLTQSDQTQKLTDNICKQADHWFGLVSMWFRNNKLMIIHIHTSSKLWHKAH